MGDLIRPIGEHAVHLCIDMQRLFAPGGPWAAAWVERVQPVIASLVELSPARTLFTRFIPAKSAEEAPGMWGRYYRKWHQVTLDELDPDFLRLLPTLETYVPPAQAFDRSTYSAFADGRLHDVLRAKAVNTLIISGSETDVCVLATVLAAVDYGYRTIIASDALASSSDKTHDALMKLYGERFSTQIELAHTDEIRGAWKL